MTDRWIIFVSDRVGLKQLESEPETVLSMEQALHEVCSHGPTSLQFSIVRISLKKRQLAFTEPILGYLQVPPEHKGPKSEAFRVMIGVLKNKLRSNIPAMGSAFRARVAQAIAMEVAPLDGMHNRAEIALAYHSYRHLHTSLDC